MATAVGTWALMIGVCSGYWLCWKFGKVREVDNKEVALIKALGEVVAKANGTYGMQQPDSPIEGQPEIWFSDVTEEVDPYMETDNVE